MTARAFPTVNRSAVVLVPTAAMFDWLNKCADPPRNLSLKEFQSDSSVYLTPDEKGDAETHLRKNCKALFEQELASWTADESVWPEKRTFREFKRFFDIHIHTVVFDVGRNDIRHDCIL